MTEFRIKHSLDDNYYKERYCPFCGEELTEEMEDELEDYQMNEDSICKHTQKVEDLQQWFDSNERDLLVSKLGIHKEDIESRSMVILVVKTSLCQGLHDKSSHIRLSVRTKRR